MAVNQKRISRRAAALLWCLVVGIGIGVLIYFEQIALLYILATLAITVLLLIVAFADLERIGAEIRISGRAFEKNQRRGLSGLKMIRGIGKIFSAVLSLIFFGGAAAAYTVQSADGTNRARLHWKNGAVTIAVSSSLFKQNPNIKPDSDISGAIERSLLAWRSAANLRLNEVASDKQSVSAAGKTGDGTSLLTIAPTAENLLLFGADGAEIAARTRVFYNRSGLITEADIVLNPYAQFSTDGSVGTFDLEATLTHEIGHLLGLEHSPVTGATMHLHQNKNGIYGLPTFSPRTLAADDVAGIRALYGARPDETGECCAAAGGKLTLSNGKAAKDFQVWAESAATGQVAAGVLTDAEGVYQIEGLTAGDYRLFAQPLAGKNYAAQSLGNVTVVKDKIILLNQRLDAAEKNFDFRLLGFNAQISELAVPVNAGKSYQIFIAGKNLDPQKFRIEFSAPYFSITPRSVAAQDYGDELSVISFELQITENAPPGEYSIVVRDDKGKSSAIVGGLTVETEINPWYSRFFN